MLKNYMRSFENERKIERGKLERRSLLAERKTFEKLSASGAQNFLLGVLKLWIHEGYSTYTFSLVYVCRSKILFFQFE